MIFQGGGVPIKIRELIEDFALNWDSLPKDEIRSFSCATGKEEWLHLPENIGTDYPAVISRTFIDIIRYISDSNIDVRTMTSSMTKIDHEWSGNFERCSGLLRVRKYSERESFKILRFRIQFRNVPLDQLTYIDPVMDINSGFRSDEDGVFSLDYFPMEFYQKLAALYGSKSPIAPLSDVLKANNNIMERYERGGEWA